MAENTETVRCDHIPCGCFIEKCKAISEGGGFFCDKQCAKHPLTGNKCGCGHSECR